MWNFILEFYSGILFWNFILEFSFWNFHFGIFILEFILWIIRGSPPPKKNPNFFYFGILSWNFILEFYFGILFWNFILEFYFGILFWGDFPPFIRSHKIYLEHDKLRLLSCQVLTSTGLCFPNMWMCTHSSWS
jgi:hypothetical protein